MIFLLSLWSKFKGWLIGAGVAITLVLGAYLKGRSDQKETLQNKELKDRIKSINQSKEVNDEVRKMSPSDVDRELDRFMRD